MTGEGGRGRVIVGARRLRQSMTDNTWLAASPELCSYPGDGRANLSLYG